MSPCIDTHTLSQLISDHVPAMDSNSFSPSEWNILLPLAQREGVAALLYWRLSKSGNFSSLPESARNTLRIMYANSWAQNHKILKELGVITRLFHQEGIPVVVLKGACYALTIYSDIGLRPMGDLDILVPAPQLSLAVQIARSFGYHDSLPEASPGLRSLLNHEICLQKPGQSFSLEIHHSLVADRTYTYAVSMDWFWEQTEALNDLPSQARFQNLRTLTPTAQLLYAAAHSMLQHGGNNTPLRWYYDLDCLIRIHDGRLDWDLLLLQAKAFEWGSALSAALSQTQAYFDTPVPEKVSADLSTRSDRLESLVSLKQNGAATHTLQESQRLMSLNAYGRLRLILALLFPGPAYMRWRYKFQTSWKFPLYYLFRWAGILRDGFYTALALIQNRGQPD
jgi:hypothetical protein